MIAKISAMLNNPRGRQLFDRLGPLAVILLAAIARFYNLGYPRALVFDETYYVKDAWTLSHLGYESGWVAENAKFEAGDVSGFNTFASFVVHPPLGKWLIALGMNLFGAEHAFSWRVSTAVFGVLAVGLLMLVAKRLLKSTLWAVVAGLFFAIDGHAIVMARTGLLDNFLMFFVLLAFYCLLRDKTQVTADLTRRNEADPRFNGVIWRRPWLLAMGIALGAACGVKWSGIYFIAVFGLYLVVSETLTRRRLRQPDWALAGLTGQSLVTFLLLVPISFLAYLSTWTGWLITKGGYDRTWAEGADRAFTGLLSWVPLNLQSLWHYHVDAYAFHVGLHTPHSYASSPLTWLYLLRPTSFYYQGVEYGKSGCEEVMGCSSAITALGNPLIWWGAATALLYLVYRWLRTRDSTIGLILLGIAAGYLPWMFYLNRTVFQFYAIAFEPWLILALVYALRHYLQMQRGFYWWRAARQISFGIGAAVAVSVFYYPIWTAISVPYWFWLMHMWLPTWI